ncbi:loganic acid O-methyltransferase-like isoform X2 [Punica granatum]|nr:loganic acid O-methyltransferase-like isoform X2 [Punica granatum]OWM76928.1 hypothetical protein CDL15_Pgr021210 [Punica granatum]PKI67126.1 hypothetical protein CRG98_012454 [Punica granatum]
MNIFDVKHLSLTSRICLADLGCAVGPNTFMSMQNILECIKKKYHFQFPDAKPPDFMVFFNDLPSNDFNTLFNSLPLDGCYFAVGVPGSFHGRLFPESSIHLFHSVSSLHWLSRVPREIFDESSRARNRGRIHYTNAPAEVMNAYKAQFGRDMEEFLSARAKEIVLGGIMFITMAGIPDEMVHSQLPAGVMYDILGRCLMEMAKEGVITEDQVDSFNLPIYAASCEEMTELIQRNGSFAIKAMELINPSLGMTGPTNIQEWTNHVRAAMEGLFIAHFRARSVVDEIFDRLGKKLEEDAHLVEASYREKIVLFAILRRI